METGRAADQVSEFCSEEVPASARSVVMRQSCGASLRFAGREMTGMRAAASGWEPAVSSAPPRKVLVAETKCNSALLSAVKLNTHSVYRVLDIVDGGVRSSSCLC